MGGPELGQRPRDGALRLVEEVQHRVVLDRDLRRGLVVRREILPGGLVVEGVRQDEAGGADHFLEAAVGVLAVARDRRPPGAVLALEARIVREHLMGALGFEVVGQLGEEVEALDASGDVRVGHELEDAVGVIAAALPPAAAGPVLPERGDELLPPLDLLHVLDEFLGARVLRVGGIPGQAEAHEPPQVRVVPGGDEGVHPRDVVRVEHLVEVVDERRPLLRGEPGEARVVGLGDRPHALFELDVLRRNPLGDDLLRVGDRGPRELGVVGDEGGESAGAAAKVSRGAARFGGLEDRGPEAGLRPGELEDLFRGA